MNDLTNNQNTSGFFENVAQIIEKARRFVGRTADLTMCVTYYEVGRMIVEEEQGGKTRAEYGRGLLNDCRIEGTDTRTQLTLNVASG